VTKTVKEAIIVSVVSGKIASSARHLALIAMISDSLYHPHLGNQCPLPVLAMRAGRTDYLVQFRAAGHEELAVADMPWTARRGVASPCYQYKIMVAQFTSCNKAHREMNDWLFQHGLASPETNAKWFLSVPGRRREESHVILRVTASPTSSTRVIFLCHPTNNISL
jgi:hypothetical protein